MDSRNTRDGERSGRAMQAGELRSLLALTMRTGRSHRSALCNQLLLALLYTYPIPEAGRVGLSLPAQSSCVPRRTICYITSSNSTRASAISDRATRSGRSAILEILLWRAYESGHSLRLLLLVWVWVMSFCGFGWLGVVCPHGLSACYF